MESNFVRLIYLSLTYRTQVKKNNAEFALMTEANEYLEKGGKVDHKH